MDRECKYIVGGLTFIGGIVVILGGTSTLSLHTLLNGTSWNSQPAQSSVTIESLQKLEHLVMVGGMEEKGHSKIFI